MNYFIIKKLNNYFSDNNMNVFVNEIYHYYKYGNNEINHKRIKYHNPININLIIQDIKYNLLCLDGDYDMFFDMNEFIYKFNQIL